MVPCRHRYPERDSKECGSQRLAGELKSESRNSESREIRQQHTADGIATIHIETFIGCGAHLHKAVARIRGVWQHRGKPGGKGSIVEVNARLHGCADRRVRRVNTGTVLMFDATKTSTKGKRRHQCRRT